MRTYGQYCPIARGAEIFAERWTPLIVRNLYLGCGSFGEILEGAPGLSRTLLSQRLKQLETENRRLKKLVADLSLDKQILQEVVDRKW